MHSEISPLVIIYFADPLTLHKPTDELAPEKPSTKIEGSEVRSNRNHGAQGDYGNDSIKAKKMKSVGKNREPAIFKYHFPSSATSQISQFATTIVQFLAYFFVNLHRTVEHLPNPY